MRHIMIDLFASPLGPSCPNLIFTIFPQPQRPISSDISFSHSRLYTLSAVSKGVLITWRQGPGIFVRAYSLIPPLLQPIPNFAKTLTSHDAHSTIIISLLSTRANASTYITVGSRIFLQQATNIFYNIRISPAFEGGLEGVAPGKAEYFASENWFMEKAPHCFGFSEGNNLG